VVASIFGHHINLAIFKFPLAVTRHLQVIIDSIKVKAKKDVNGKT
jgi:hypothetical protein